MNRNEVEQFIITNSPDNILQWLAQQASPKETTLAKRIMRHAINNADVSCNLMENKGILTTTCIMGIS